MKPPFAAYMLIKITIYTFILIDKQDVLNFLPCLAQCPCRHPIYTFILPEGCSVKAFQFCFEGGF